MLSRQTRQYYACKMWDSVRLVWQRQWIQIASIWSSTRFKSYLSALTNGGRLCTVTFNQSLPLSPPLKFSGIHKFPFPFDYASRHRDSWYSILAGHNSFDFDKWQSPLVFAQTAWIPDVNNRQQKQQMQAVRSNTYWLLTNNSFDHTEVLRLHECHFNTGVGQEVQFNQTEFPRILPNSVS